MSHIPTPYARAAMSDEDIEEVYRTVPAGVPASIIGESRCGPWTASIGPVRETAAMKPIYAWRKAVRAYHEAAVEEATA